MRSTSRILVWTGALILTAPAIASANVGVPMIVPTGVLMLGALVPIIGLEAWILGRELGTSFASALGASAWANVVTTAVGLPLNWIAGGLSGKLAAGLLEYSDAIWARLVRRVLQNLFWVLPGFENVDWLIYIAQLFLLVPLFFISWWLETQTVDWRLGTKASDAVFSANLASYSLLALVPIYLLLRENGRKSLLDALARAQIAPSNRARNDARDELDFFYPAAALEIKSPDGSLAISYDETGHTLWDMANEHELCRLEGEADFGVATFSNSGKYVAVGARVWSCETGSLVIDSHAVGFDHAFSPDDTIFAATDEHSSDRDSRDVCVWSLPSGALLHRLETFDAYAQLEFPDADHILVEDSRHGITRFRTVDWRTVPQ